MTSSGEARQGLLDALAEPVDHVGVALADLGGAYELLDETTGDRLEAELFRPVQSAYGRAQRAHAGFAERHGLSGRPFVPAPEPLQSRGIRGLIDAAVESAGRADAALGTLQDSMLLVELGDAELRADVAEVRRLLGEVPGRARTVTRTLGR